MRKRVGIVVFQLGGPDKPEAVEPFLYNLFCDPDIIPLGPLGAILRKPLARYISRKRAPSSVRIITTKSADSLRFGC